MKSDFSLEAAQRLSVVETHVDVVQETVSEHGDRLNTHGKIITDLDQDLRAVIKEVQGVKRAMYTVAVAVAANVPQLQNLASTIKAFLGI